MNKVEIYRGWYKKYGICIAFYLKAVLKAGQSEHFTPGEIRAGTGKIHPYVIKSQRLISGEAFMGRYELKSILPAGNYYFSGDEAVAEAVKLTNTGPDVVLICVREGKVLNQVTRWRSPWA
jgi:hypothetical protein|tara:strand:+ start:1843 stop:2205 length:363 start_codon:yes stop_codon:yes gene_type:complete